jgi:hypothetical protein
MQLPLWAVFVAVVLVVLASIEGGLLLARRGRGPSEGESSPVGTIVGSIVGLLALMLAFTFGVAASKFDRRRELLLKEVNAIETTFLRADLLPEPHRAEVRSLLVEYARVRAQVGRQPENVRELIQESERIQARLWPHAAALPALELKNPALTALFIVALNETLDLHQERVTVGFYHIPSILWLAVLLLTLLAMTGVGYLYRAVGKVNWILSTVLAFSLASVIALIADLDRPGEGFLRVGQQPMADLVERLAQPSR